MTSAEVACEHGENDERGALLSAGSSHSRAVSVPAFGTHPKQFRTCDHDSQAPWRGEYISKKLAPAACGAGVADELALSFGGPLFRPALAHTSARRQSECRQVEPARFAGCHGVDHSGVRDRRLDGRGIDRPRRGAVGVPASESALDKANEHAMRAVRGDESGMVLEVVNAAGGAVPGQES